MSEQETNNAVEAMVVETGPSGPGLESPRTEKTVRPAEGTASPDVKTEIRESSCGPSGCAGGQSFVYAYGNLKTVFPSTSVEKEYLTIISCMEKGEGVKPVLNNLSYFDVFSQGANLYLTREVCWVLEINSVDTYIVQPRSYVELYEFISAITFTPDQRKYSVIIGPRGPMAPPEMCGFLHLPTVVCNQFYHFPFEDFVKLIMKDAGITLEEAERILDGLLEIADNAGETPEDRAINYLILHYKEIYAKTSEMFKGNYTLAGVSAKPADLSRTRQVIDVIFRYRQMETDEVNDWFCKVDVTEQFPFLVRKLTRYFPKQ